MQSEKCSYTVNFIARKNGRLFTTIKNYAKLDTATKHLIKLWQKHYSAGNVVTLARVIDSRGEVFITNTHYVIMFTTFIDPLEFSTVDCTTEYNKNFNDKTVKNCENIYITEGNAAASAKSYTITRQEFKDLLKDNKQAEFFNIDGIYLSVKYLKRFYACNKSITFYHNRKEFYPVFFTGDKFNGVLAPMRIKYDTETTVKTPDGLKVAKSIIYPVKGGE